MSGWLRDKVRQVCPRCGAPSSETSVLCEPHRLDAVARQSRWSALRRPLRRRLRRCAYCAAPSLTYRCASCAEKRRRWDAGEPVRDLAAAGARPPQQELDFGVATAAPESADEED